MQGHHLSEDFLRRFATSTADIDEIEMALEHVSVCASCRGLLGATRASLLSKIQEPTGHGNWPKYGIDAYTPALDAVAGRLAGESVALEREREIAPALLEELERYAPSRQLLVAKNSRKFHLWGFSEFLLEKCRRIWVEEPHRAESLALLALIVSENLPCSGFRAKVVSDLKAEAWSYAANSRRIQRNFLGAQEAFDLADGYLETGTGDVLERARVADLKASLMRDQERFSEARDLLEFAASVYRSSGETRLEAKALLGFSKLVGDMGRAEECLPFIERARELLRIDGDHTLELTAGVHLFYSLMESGRTSEASSLLPDLRELVASYGNRIDRLQLLWLEGRLCQTLGQVELAEELFYQAREGYAAASRVYEVALLSLNLAALYLETGRTAEVKRLALEAVPQFASTQLDSDALAAIALFEQAARKESATLALVDEVASKVRSCQGRKTPKKS